MKKVYIFFFFISALLAHPHTFIEVYPTIRVNDTSTSDINFKWVLDDMTSTILIIELDSNGDGEINEKENSFIEKEYFSIFKAYDYYTYVFLDGKKVKLPKPENFRATIENNKICYSFDIKLNHNIKDVAIEFGDSSYYVSMVLKNKFVNAQGLKIQVTDVDNENYYGHRLELK